MLGDLRAKIADSLLRGAFRVRHGASYKRARVRQSADANPDYRCGGTFSRSVSSSFADGWSSVGGTGFSFGPSLGGAASTVGSVIFHGFGDLVAALFSFAFEDFFEVCFDFVLLFFFFVLVADDFFGSLATEEATGRG